MNSHNSDPRGAFDLNSFPMVRALPGLGDNIENLSKMEGQDRPAPGLALGLTDMEGN